MIKQIIVLLVILTLFTQFSPLVSAHPGHDHDEIGQVIDLEQSEVEATDSAEIVEENVEYELPYPGMLPDNPLYFLKTFRDAVVKFLISDSLKKIEFNILTANKRAYAAVLLAEKANYESSLETLSKSNNYLHEAVSGIESARLENLEVNSVLDNARKSVKKHQEVFSRQIEPNIPESMRESFNNEMERLESIENSVENLASE